MTQEHERLTAIPTPRFAIGDRAYFVSTRQTVAQHPCPDCLGTRKWKVVTGAGAELECACQRCSNSYSRDMPTLKYKMHVYSVQALTIGSIQIDTAKSYGDPVRYMCHETGIGSGQVYDESRLYSTEEEAERIGVAEAATRQQVSDATPEAIRTAHLSSITLKDALIEQCSSAVWNSWYRARSILEDLSGFLEEDGTLKADDRERLEEIIDSDKYKVGVHPMAQIIAALRAGDAAQALALIPGAADTETV